MSKGIHFSHIHAIQVELTVWWTINIVTQIDTVLYFKNTSLSMAVILVITVVSRVVHVITVVSGVVLIVTMVSRVGKEERSRDAPCASNRTAGSRDLPWGKCRTT